MEEFFILKNIITQGLKSGYMKKQTLGEIGGLGMHDGKWILSSGVEIGSTWDVILSRDFAQSMWGESGLEKLTKMVVMTSQERVEFLKEFVSEDRVVDVENSDKDGDLYEAPADALTMAVRDSLSRLKEYSFGLYKESCQNTYNNLKGVVTKNSVTELLEKDFIIMNAMDRAMAGGLSKYLNENSKSSFTICPECSVDDFIHRSGCSIDIKTTDWLINQNDGC